MFDILFRLIGMDERETCPAHFWFYKGFVSRFHRNIEQLWLESTFLDYLTQLLFFNTHNKPGRSQSFTIFYFSDSTWT